MSQSIRSIKGIGEKSEKLFQKLHIETTDQLAHHYPRCYMTYPDPVEISDLRTGMRCSVKARLESPIHARSYGKRKICTCLVADQTGSLFLRWFNMPWLKNTVRQGQEFVFTGIPVFKDGRLMMEQPEYCAPEAYAKKMETFQPVYPLTAGLSNNLVRKSLQSLFETYRPQEYLPENVRKYYDLMEEDRALYGVHFPESAKVLDRARRRIIFDEFFRFFGALTMVRDREEKALNGHLIPMDERVDAFVEALPFTLTGAQKSVIHDIRQDFLGTRAMNRLVQGDVGSGKTIVAVVAMYACVLAGKQAVMMAPTEVLASQHYDTVSRQLGPYGIRIGLLTGHTKAGAKRELLEQTRTGQMDILIGTHALIEDKVSFQDLALVITDEQHRFGVRQRNRLMNKGDHPHVLVMSATPIPRTLAIILYRGLDVSVMNELPASRLPIKNSVVGEAWRANAWNFMNKQVMMGHQCYVICPMIEADEDQSLQNVEEYTRMLSASMPPSVSVAALNGRMNAAQKSEVMEAFSSGRTDILVSTTVVEVGIDVPNATVMLIENAERFGLAQLHQLRGRVGRGQAQSYCIFLSGTQDQEAMERLQIIGRSNDGFEIAREDLKLRGPGDFFGTKQSGTMQFALGDIYANADIMKEASEAVDFMREDGYQFEEIAPYALDEYLEYANNI